MYEGRGDGHRPALYELGAASVRHRHSDEDDDGDDEHLEMV